MKKNVLFVAGLVCLILLGACQKTPENSSAFTMDKDTSYAMGMYLATQFPIPDVHYDYRALMEGFRDYCENQETRFSMDEGIMKINTAFEAYMAKAGITPEAAGGGDTAQNLADGEAFLAENGKRPEVTTTASGLQYEVITQGTGERPGASDTVQVHYEGKLLDGTVFDSSYARGEPATFPLDGVIAAWTEGVQLMSVGSVYNLYCPPDLGYGPYGNTGIPGNSTLIFKVELLSIVK